MLGQEPGSGLTEVALIDAAGFKDIEQTTEVWVSREYLTSDRTGLVSSQAVRR